MARFPPTVAAVVAVTARSYSLIGSAVRPSNSQMRSEALAASTPPARRLGAYTLVHTRRVVTKLMAEKKMVSEFVTTVPPPSAPVKITPAL